MTDNTILWLYGDGSIVIDFTEALTGEQIVSEYDFIYTPDSVDDTDVLEAVAELTVNFYRSPRAIELGVRFVGNLPDGSMIFARGDMVARVQDIIIDILPASDFRALKGTIENQIAQLEAQLNVIEGV